MKKMNLKCIFLFIFLIFLINNVTAGIDNLDYYFIIEENGNVFVGMEFNGNGEITIPLQEDVEEVYVKGGLYIMNENSMIVSIGSTESAVLLYKTSMLTQKMDKEWTFSIELQNEINKSVLVAMPLNTIVIASDPVARLQNEDFIKINFDNPDLINIKYHYPKILENPEEDNEKRKKGDGGIETLKIDEEKKVPEITLKFEGQDKIELKNSGLNYVKKNTNLQIFLICLMIFSGSFLYFVYSKKSKIINPRQMQIIQTLTDNESKIIMELLQSKSLLKRSLIEKKLNIAKSSLAATMNNLERKKIIEIDRMNSSHKIKLADWFKKL